MKVYDILVQEGIKSRLGQMFSKQAERKFLSKAEEMAFTNASETLSDVMLRQLQRGEIKDASQIINPWSYVSKELSGTQWAKDKSWLEDMMVTAAKDANARFTGKAAGTATKTAEKEAPTASKSYYKTVLNVLLGYELFTNVEDVMNNPTNGYFTVMNVLADELKQGVLTQEQFDQQHEKQLRLVASRLAWVTGPLLGMAVVSTAFTALNLATLTLLSKQLAKLESAVSVAEKTLYTAYLAYLNSNIKIPGTDMTPKQGITFLIVLDAIKTPVGTLSVPSPISSGLGWLAGAVEKGLVAAYESLAAKYATNVNTALNKVGVTKQIPTTVPWSGTKQPATPAPTTAPAAGAAPVPTTGEFNPADWKSIAGGAVWQNKKTGKQIHDTEYQELLQQR